MTATIPDSHCDLLVQAIHGVLTTLMPDGQPHSSIVWVDYDGRHLLLNTTLERQKGAQYAPQSNSDPTGN